MPYRIVVRPSATKAIEGLPDPHRERVRWAIRGLADNPRPPGVKKLRGAEDYYRFRVGNYRIVYRAKDRIITVTVVRVGHRRDVYRNL